jgi:hypothetical protein
VQDAQMPGNTGLMDSRLLDNVTDLHLAVPQDFDNEAAGGVGQGLEHIYMHDRVYV